MEYDFTQFQTPKRWEKIMQLGEGKGKEYIATIIAFTICHIKVDAWILPANLVPKELRDCLHTISIIMQTSTECLLVRCGMSIDERCVQWLQNRAKFWACECIKTVWRSLETPDYVSHKWRCILWGSEIIKMIRNGPQSWWKAHKNG